MKKRDEMVGEIKSHVFDDHEESHFRSILEACRDKIIDRTTKVKKFIVEIEKRIAKNEKSKIGTLLISLISLKYKVKGNIKEYIIEMSHFASKLKTLKL